MGQPWPWPSWDSTKGFRGLYPLLPCRPQVASEVVPAECGWGRKLEAALEVLPPMASGPAEQVRVELLLLEQVERA